MTPEQLRLLDFIREEIADKGMAPSYPEMQARIGRSRSSVHRLVTGLVQSGLLIRTRNQARGLTLPNEANIAGIPTDRLEAELRRRGRQPAWSRDFLKGFGRPQFPLHGSGDGHG
jgi:SOS-response transcriptional repressor LexA